ncbi:hypothetical protein [Pseudonocardia sp. NPDC049635]|uniref:hypothetical protein n=1 Tax=Pseudonocardia sp. NPDC049635 TaxID=3155506 RepID=UPI0034033649
MTVQQRFGAGTLRPLPAGRAVTASADGRPCFLVTSADVAAELGCVSCHAPFEQGSYYTERPVGRTDAGDDLVEVICVTCAQAGTDDAPDLVPVLGQDRDLPDPDGWVRASAPVVVVEGMQTGDGRRIDVGGLTHRALPHALMSLSRTSEGGHLDATVAGRIDKLERVPGPEVTNIDTGEPFPEGTYVWRAPELYVNPEHPDYALMYAGALTGLSVDLAETVADFEFDEDDPDDEGVLVLRSGRMAAATVCTIPAFPGAHIVLPDDAPAPGQSAAPLAASAVESGRGRAFRLETESALCASCVTPPSEWFTDPGLTEPTPLQVTEDGRVFGHIADWTTCHIGLPGCTRTPRSRSGYAYFLTGYVLTSDGEQVPVGQLTLGTGHADLSQGAQAAVAHYDNTGAAVADIAVGEDEHGIWCAGALRPGVTEEQVRVLRASPPSGDWRPINGSHELVAVLNVNTPGFPIPRVQARVASGRTTALIAAGPAATSMTKETQMAPTPKGVPGEEEPAEDAEETSAVSPGDMVTIAAGGELVGTVVGADGDNVTVEVVCDASLITVTEPEDAVSAGAGLPPDQLRMLRSVRARHVLDTVSRG